MDKAIRSYIAEFIGTFMLVFVGTAVVTFTGLEKELGHGDARWLEISFAFGFTLMVLVYVIGPVSGCHVNPAVTLGAVLAGRIKWGQVPGYMIAQFVGAAAASAALHYIASNGIPGYVFGHHGLGANDLRQLSGPDGKLVPIGWQSMLILETLMTALFLFTILSVTKKDIAFVGFAIGGFLFVSHLVGAQLGDSSLNPARSFGPAIIVGGTALSNLWIFIVGPFVGSIGGWLIYKVVNAD
ncbi:MAG: aquaporin [Planctomycetia bacterium]|nr:aquaporin [Planctomycetia bacterium]